MALAESPFKVAVVGAGIAGATCARVLTAAGCAVHVVDKSRGPGGRLATRRLEWTDGQGRPHVAKVDHGAPAFAAHTAGFREFLARTAGPGALTPWTPALASGSRPLDDAGALCLPVPDMPSLCRALLRDIAGTWSFPVDRLLRGPLGWQVEAAGARLPGHFDAVVLALPPAQASPLLSEHRRDWAQRTSLALVQPCWTLMGVAHRPDEELPWDVGRPQDGSLACVLRADARPGRAADAQDAVWVAHARAGWSRRHLEQPAEWVRAQLLAALQEWLGQPIDWRHAVVHRWRYATPMPSGAAVASRCCWDDVQGLGVCGDWFVGTGVEGAWQSAQALSDLVLQRAASLSCRSHSPDAVGTSA